MRKEVTLFTNEYEAYNFASSVNGEVRKTLDDIFIVTYEK